jgi:hypothetical protein
MTFFLVLAGLKAVETVARGYKPPLTTYPPPTHPPTYPTYPTYPPTYPPTSLHERGTYGDDDTSQ